MSLFSLSQNGARAWDTGDEELQWSEEGWVTSSIVASPTFTWLGINWNNEKISDLKGMLCFPYPH